jgi:hypothetical protein
VVARPAPINIAWNADSLDWLATAEKLDSLELKIVLCWRVPDAVVPVELNRVAGKPVALPSEGAVDRSPLQRRHRLRKRSRLHLGRAAR